LRRKLSGIAQGAFEAAVKYAKERQQFKKPIASLQTIQNYIADMATEQRRRACFCTAPVP
jgi:alkylation response protein AidB-like acyl-CoA dehydrogenase